MFTIAHDIARLREYRDGEVILEQSKDSPYNIEYQKAEKNAIDQFFGKNDN